MKLKVTFICTTCRYLNRMNGEDRRIEFDSFTEAHNHLHEIDKEHHYIEIEITEEKE